MIIDKFMYLNNKVGSIYLIMVAWFSDFRIIRNSSMAFSRLFGKGKRDVSSPTEHLETTEKDDTVIVNTPQSSSLYPAVNSPGQGQGMYPGINQAAIEGLPYQLPHRPAPAPVSEQFQNMSIRQDSTGWQPLQGVQFTLNSR